MKNLFLLVILTALVLTGCANKGGNVDVEAVNKEAAKEKAINEKALKDNPPPPGQGPSM